MTTGVAAPATGRVDRDLRRADRALPTVAAIAVRALGVTLRLTVRGTEPLVPLWRARRAMIYVAWHGRILMMPWANARLRRTIGARRATVLASLSRDGDLIAGFTACFGLPAVRGSSSRGGAAAVRALAAVLRAREDVVIVPDGPRGPARCLQPGVVTLAAMTGAPIVPLAFAARPRIVLDTWDRFLIPVPFARAAVVFGAPVEVPRHADRDEAARRVAAALDAVTGLADELTR
jgi:lysophospholipid acyltransferase (LPLAT)-like uncharacterized protein